MKNNGNEPVKDKSGKNIAARQTDAEGSISEEDIRKRAHELFLERGDLYAPPEGDWLKASTLLPKPAIRRNWYFSMPI